MGFSAEAYNVFGRFAKRDRFGRDLFFAIRSLLGAAFSANVTI
jgi:hypothetical protein